MRQPPSEENSVAKQREFEKLAVIHLDALYNTALRLTRNRIEAEDLIQDVYVRAYRFFDKFQRDTNCKAWMFKILTNTFINHYRKSINRPRLVEIDRVSYTLSADNKDSHILAIEEFTSKDYENFFDDEITKALNQLSNDFRMVVLLADVESFSYKEIAKMLACPIGTVMSRLSRGRKQLQLYLREYAIRGGFIGNKQG